MKLVFSKHAEDELENIYSFIYAKNERAAAKIYNHILDEIERLLIFPQMAPVEPLLQDEPQSFRSLVVLHTYKVIYFIDEEHIHIASIWDCRQNPKTLKKNLFTK